MRALLLALLSLLAVAGGALSAPGACGSLLGCFLEGPSCCEQEAQILTKVAPPPCECCQRPEAVEVLGVASFHKTAEPSLTQPLVAAATVDLARDLPSIRTEGSIAWRSPPIRPDTPTHQRVVLLI